MMLESNRLAKSAVETLKEKRLTIATAESCTGGWLGKLMTDIPGSSTVYLGGVISYTNGVKSALLGVDDELLNTLGPVSAPVAEAMARGIRRAIGSTFGIGVTGLAGPDSDDSGRPVGLVYVALADEMQTICQQLYLTGDRLSIREQACCACLKLLLGRLQ